MKTLISINKFKGIVEVKMRVMNLKLKCIMLVKPITSSDE